MELLRDPEFRSRARLDRDAHSEKSGILRGLAIWEQHDRSIRRTHPRRSGAVPRPNGSVRSRKPWVTSSPSMRFVDIALADGLKTSFHASLDVATDDASWKLRDPRPGSTTAPSSAPRMRAPTST